ncbi:Predicted arabinose efflux permease, MFS family [Caldanaerovirga acetigignens]|uniref:Predicted arabinose efflux permease, MFS family n=1 Tax=Caldanaerovirga acetigignens TaxID=447595 RepID=A0A1M7IY11_9FIRM|nr:MFS transporter [Caldanaerovirga acetigignens]SHM45602.1 Predicted arabinose efflux permease, MFS family [Caldanaerovirga acetigignens]
MEEKNSRKKNVDVNFSAFSYDAIFFSAFGGFFEPATVISSFVSNLTNSPVLIGLTTTIRNCGWFLPQLFIARRAEAMPRKKPLVALAGGIMRFSAGMMVLSSLIAGKNPILSLFLFYAFFVVLSFSDGISGVPWIDLFAKCIPLERRGDYYAKTQAIGGVLAFIAGFAVKAILGLKSIAFPYNYTIIFSLGFVFSTLSFLSFLRLKEAEDGTPRRHESLAKYFMGIPKVFREDGNFRLLIVINTLLRGFFMPLPFYALFAREILGIPQENIGIFVSTQMVGSILAGIFFGKAIDLYGSRKVVILTAGITLLQPFMALASFLLYKLGLPFFWLYALIFTLIGATYSGIWTGIFNYLLRIAPEEKRPLYIGLLNTLTAPTTFLPLLGGIILQYLSYVHLFLITALVVASSVVTAFALKEPEK